MTATPELKACPFCAIPLAVYGDLWLHAACEGDCFLISGVVIKEGNAVEIDRWNRRADDERVGKLVNLCWKVLRYEWLSDECSPPGTPTRGYPQLLADELRAAIEPHFDK